MRRWILVLFLVAMVLPAINFAGQTADDSNQQRWQTAFALRVKVIEERHGIKFDPKWEPTFIFGIPDDIPPQLRTRFGAQYVPESQSFVVSPAEKREIDFSLIDHELGHALADQISRRAGYGMWPDIKGFAGLEWDERTGINIISEGIGTYFQYQGRAPYPKDDSEGYEWLPEGFGDPVWRLRDFLYNGGRWLVAPIIKKFGERGILYLITHRLRFKNYMARIAGQEYQRLALEQLAGN